MKLIPFYRVPGDIKGRHKEYRELAYKEYVINTIKHGYWLVLKDSPPPSSFAAKNSSALEDPVFVRAELERLESLGCIGRVMEQPLVMLPMSRVFSNKWRLMLDASRGLNPWCKRRGIKLDDLGHMCTVVNQDDFMVCNDQDSGYWHVPMAEEVRQHPLQGGGREHHLLDVKGAGIGAAKSRQIFTRLLVPLVAQLIIYIDDFFVTVASKLLALEQEQRA